MEAESVRLENGFGQLEFCGKRRSEKQMLLFFSVVVVLLQGQYLGKEGVSRAGLGFGVVV